ncbi:mechanosensitive ion channel family protein [Aquipuribacter hungaricus]|uniref:Mechanosensitive ion channel family protein n=1 Tax=Aquipuribacter hungaricus TaxID=545624 RepID=A0ABV7WDH5_9MICO
MLPATPAPALPAQPSLTALPGASPSAEPEPTPTSTGAIREAVDGLAGGVTDQNCGTQDGTLCGLLNRALGDIEQARFVSDLVSVPLFVIAVLLVAAVVRWVLRRVIRRWVERIETEGPRRRGRIDLFEPSDPLTSERRVQRAKAIGSILTAVVSIVVWTAAVFKILPALGVDITGLVAGAGIVGIALGFGAQTLVQDFVSGLFMIAEDQYGVGDVIDMGEASGVVEAVGLRTTRLRSVDGTVWHIRNGEVVRVGNMSQGWSRAVLDVGVAYGEDVSRVMELLGRLGSEMRADPDFADKFLDEPEVWGVEALAADQVTIRMIIKTVPLEQWVVAREMRRRIKHAFDTLGIEIPFPQRTVWMRAEGPTGPGAPSGSRRAGRTAPPERARGGTHAIPVVGAVDTTVPRSPVDASRGEGSVSHEDAPEPGSGEPFRPAPERDPRRRRG